MRYAELLFLVLLVLYQAVLFVPRHKRVFAANYLVFLAGMALAWNLGLEGLRWQTLPAIALLLIDLAVLFPTFARLRGTVPRPGFLSMLGGTLRTLVVATGFVVAGASVVLAVAFPLPKVELTGGLSPSYRVVRFPPSAGHEGLELRLWYPATGDQRPQPRAIAEAEAWQRLKTSAGLPVFWHSHLAHLPSAAILGGRLAAPKSKYPVVFVSVPAGDDAIHFAYLWEDLASRGFLVVAAGPIPAALPEPVPFQWSQALAELAQPWLRPQLWLEPEANLESQRLAPNEDRLVLARSALQQLSSEPGDLLFQSIDWGRQGTWSFGNADGAAAVLRVGSEELWITDLREATGPTLEGRWVLSVPGLRRADLADAAYLKPYEALVGLKSQADAGHHGAIRQYQAAFYQYAFWHSSGTDFGQTVPNLPGLTLTGP